MRLAVCLSLSLLVLSGCDEKESPPGKPGAPGGGGSGTPPAPPPAPPPATAETLESVSQAFADARAKGDTARLVGLTKSLLPTVDDLKKVLREGPDTDAFLAKYDVAGMREHAAEIATEVLKHEVGQTVVKVHSSTTEELIAYEKGTVAVAEFPEGMSRFAKAVAAPGRVWQVIEYLEPGKEDGMKYTCFTVLSGRVLVLHKPWRAIPEK